MMAIRKITDNRHWNPLVALQHNKRTCFTYSLKSTGDVTVGDPVGILTCFLLLPVTKQ